MKRPIFLCLLILIPLIFSCTTVKINVSEKNQPSDNNQFIEDLMNNMSLDQKIGQLFVIRPSSIDERIVVYEPNLPGAIKTTFVTPEMKKFYEKYPAGGFALFQDNIETPEQLIKYNQDLHNLGPSTNNVTPFIFIDEEGGLVSRLAGHAEFNLPEFESMASIGKTGNPENAFKTGAVIGAYLKDYGFDADFAPIADVFTNPDNKVIGTRAFSSDPETASAMVLKFMDGLHSKNIKGCIKHFPGHGDTSTDSHYGLPETLKNWNELMDCEMITFKAAINAGAEMIMTAHITVPAVTGNRLPATVSSIMLTDKLRNELGYNGVIITDALEMGAIAHVYPGVMENACVDAFIAGADLLLMPRDYKKSFMAMKNAVKDGKISIERLDESVRRILKYKMS